MVEKKKFCLISPLNPHHPPGEMVPCGDFITKQRAGDAERPKALPPAAPARRGNAGVKKIKFSPTKAAT